jgi:ketosteroid isomerase-like protein
MGALPLDEAAMDVAKAMFAAHAGGRWEEMLSYLHRDITWMPLATRPNRIVYAGHADTMQLVKDNRAALGTFRIEWEEFSQLDDGRLVCAGQTMTITDTGETPGLSFVCYLTFRDGLLFDLETESLADA